MKHHLYKYSLTKVNIVEVGSTEVASAALLSKYEPNKILLSTDSALHVMLLKEMHVQNIYNMAYTTDDPLLRIYTLSNQKRGIRAIVGRRVKCMATADQHRLLLFPNYEAMANGTPTTLDAHLSQIADIDINHTHNLIVSSGKEDGLIVEWKVKLAL